MVLADLNNSDMSLRRYDQRAITPGSSSIPQKKDKASRRQAQPKEDEAL
jgi:hypothetical protein